MSARRASAPARAEAAGGSPPSLHRLAISTPSVGACRLRPGLREACYDKLYEWEAWFDEKLQMQDWATLDRYAAEGATLLRKDETRYFSSEWREVWESMYMPWRGRKLRELYMDAQQTYDYVRTVSLAWYIRNNNGPDRIQAQVGAGCDDDPFTEIACDVKLAEWTEWLGRKQLELQNEATVESAKAVLNEYHKAGVKAWSEGLGLELSRAQKDLWVKMAAPWQDRRIVGLDLPGESEAETYDYVKAVALAWLLRHDTGELRVNAQMEASTSAIVSGWFGPDYRGMDAVCGTTILSWSELRKEVPVGTRLVVTLRKADGTLSLPRGVTLEDAMMKDPKKRVLSERTGQFVDAVILELRKPYMGESELLLKEPDMHVPVGVDRELPRGRRGYAVCKPKPQ